MKRYLEKAEDGLLKRLDHLGLAVADLDEARRRWVDQLGFREEGREKLPEQGVETIMLDGGNCRIELLAPLGENSPIARFIEKRGEGLQQAAFEVDSIDDVLGELGLQPIAPPSAGAGGLRICFLHPRDTGGVLLELVEYPD